MAEPGAVLRKTTLVYKSVESADIAADVYTPSQHPDRPLPVLVWLHGGGLTNGGRNKVYPHIMRALQQGEMVGVCPDYRLCPQVRVPAVLSDVADAFRWVVDDLSDQLQKQLPPGHHKLRLDLDRIVVLGNSAGGFLALSLAFGHNLFLPLHGPGTRYYLSRIRGVAGIYPQTQLGDTFYQTPCSQPFRGPMLPEEIHSLEKYTDPNLPVCTNTHSGPDEERNMLFRYCQQTGRLHDLLFGGLDLEEWFAIMDLPAWVRQQGARLVRALPQLQLFLAHGSEDRAVPLSQSQALAEVTTHFHIPTLFLHVLGGDHVFDASDDVEMRALWDFVQNVTCI